MNTYACRWCGSQAPPAVLKKVSSGGWVCFWLFIWCFPLNLLALFIRHEYRVCPMCGTRNPGNAMFISAQQKPRPGPPSHAWLDEDANLD
jgi:ribosomal protein L40E